MKSEFTARLFAAGGSERGRDVRCCRVFQREFRVGSGNDQLDRRRDDLNLRGRPTTSAMADPAANLVGTGCAAYAEQVPTGPGSVTGMAQDPVTVAASNNPMLKTLTQALSGQLNPT